MNRPDTLTVLKLLTKGRTPAFVADATRLPLAEVVTVAEAHGWPDRAKLLVVVNDLTLDLGAPDLPVREPTPLPSRPAPTAVTTPPRGPVAPVPGGTHNGATASPGFTVDELVRACRRSEHKRTQALGVKLTELAERISATLGTERADAEAKARRAAEREASQAEVKRLVKALAEARAKAVAAGAPGGVRGGECTCPVCGHQLANPQALGAHKRHKHGIASTRHQETSA